MKKKDVVGKTITDIRQYRSQTTGGETVFDVVEIELDDGTLMRPNVCETEGFNYLVEMLVVKPKKGGAS